ncbi:MAG: hypothetical protein ACMUIG_09590 [Thermoplasmatota archaeon]
MEDDIDHSEGSIQMNGGSSPDFKWVMKGDGGRELLRELMPRIRENPESTFLILPTKRMVTESKRIVVEELGGGFTSGIMTPRKFAHILYDRLGGSAPLGDSGLRDAAVRRIMNGIRIPHLKSRSVPVGGMAGRVSRVIGELLLNGVDPGRLGSAARGERARDLNMIFSRYMSLLRERRIVDRDMLASEVMKLLDHDREALSGIEIGVYMPGRLDRSYVDLFRELSNRCRCTEKRRRRVRKSS